MRLVTLKNGGAPVPGVAIDGTIVNLAACAGAIPVAGAIPPSVRRILQAGEDALDVVRRVSDTAIAATGTLQDRLLAAGALAPSEGTALLAPLPHPRLIMSCGMNDKKHLQEMGGGGPKEPMGFLKNVHAVIGPDASIVIPKEHPNMVDWEIELSGVFGKPCHHVSAKDALEYISGYTLVCDVTSRHTVRSYKDLVGMESALTFNAMLLDKQYPTFAPLGPALATKDELAYDDIHYELSVNGTVMQSASPDDHVFSLARLIEYFSQYYEFQPGDVITTGSPSGVGFGRKPPIFLKPGDVVTMTATGIGTMKNPVAASAN